MGPAANDCAPRLNNNTITCADNFYQSNVTENLCDDNSLRKLLQSVNETATTCTAVSPRVAGCLAHPRSPSLCRSPGHHSRARALTLEPTRAAGCLAQRPA